MIIDCSFDTTRHIDAFKAAGVTGIIRYDDRFTSGDWKQAHIRELHAMKDAGMVCGIVYEQAAVPSGEESGYLDAKYSRAMAADRGQPDGSAIYFAVDADVSLGEISGGILSYFEGVHRAFNEVSDHPKLRVGVYGSGLCCRTLVQHGLVALKWVTCSRGFRGSSAYVAAGLHDLWQHRCDATVAGQSVDLDVPNVPDWGQFVPWGVAPTPVPSPSPTPSPGPPAWPVDAGPSTGIASWYNDNANASGKPVNNAKDMTAAHRSLRFGTKVKVTRTDDSGVSAVVTIQDRGPYAAHRIIDLRPAAARALDMIDAGIVPVSLEIVP